MTTDDLDDDDSKFADLLADRMANRIMEQLSTSVISSGFPAAIGDWIREAVKHGAHISRHTIPMQGPTAIFVDYRFNPDGTLIQEFQDTNGHPFWRGTFRPAQPS